MNKIKKITLMIIKSGRFKAAMGVVFLVLLWWLGAALVDNYVILPTPIEALKELPTVFGTQSFLKKVSRTLLRTLFGFAVSMVLGAGAAFCSLNKTVEQLIKPFISFLRAVPTLVLTVVFYVWFGRDWSPIVIGMMMTFPIVYTGLLTALKNIDKNQLEMAKIYKVSNSKVVGIIYYRSVVPYIFSTAESSLGMSFKVVLSAEVLVSPLLSIGREIQGIKLEFLRTPEIFAWIIIVLFITFLLEAMIGLTRRLVVKW